MGERITIELDAQSIAAAKAAGIDLSKLLIEALGRVIGSAESLRYAIVAALDYASREY